MLTTKEFYFMLQSSTIAFELAESLTIIIMELDELYRISTFINWHPKQGIYALRLVADGYYYDEKTKLITCCECSFTVFDLQSDDMKSEIEQHRQTCIFTDKVSPISNENVDAVLRVLDIYSAANAVVSKPLPLPEPNADISLSSLGDNRFFQSENNSRVLAENTSSQSVVGVNSIRVDSSFPRNERPSTLLEECISYSGDMLIERKRLQTFKDWPKSDLVRPEDLAKDGLYYCGPGDRVRCAFCKGLMRSWEAGDVVSREHQRHYPNCAFVKGDDVGNVPIFVDPRRSSVSSLMQLLSLTNRETSPLTGDHRPKNENYTIQAARVESFKNWPEDKVQKPNELATAGFFYVGYGDYVKCFHCDVGLRNWNSTDQPWSEHAKWSPRCQFLLNLRGRDFVQEIQDNVAREMEHLHELTNPQEIILNAPASGRIAVDPREIRARLDTPRVRAVLQMGFSVDLVKTVLKDRLTTTGDDFHTVQSFVEALKRFREFEKRSQTARPTFVKSESGGKNGSGPAVAAANTSATETKAKYPTGESMNTSLAATEERSTSGTKSAAKNTSAVEPNAMVNTATVTEEDLKRGEKNSHTSGEVQSKAKLKKHGETTNEVSLRSDSLRITTGGASNSAVIGDAINSQATSTSPAMVSKKDMKQSKKTKGNSKSAVNSADVAQVQRSGATQQSAAAGASTSGASSAVVNAGTTVEVVKTKGKKRKKKTNAATNSAATCNPGADNKNENDVRNKDSISSARDLQTIDFINSISGALTDESVSLMEENRKLREARVCKICLDRETTIVFLPCGHACTCTECSVCLRECPICRNLIRSTVKLFLA